MPYILVVFSTRKDAYRLYDLLLEQGVQTKLVNKPREISASCGVAVRAPQSAYRTIMRSTGELRSYVAAYWVAPNGYRRIG